MDCLTLAADADVVRALQADDAATMDRLTAEYWYRLVRYADSILVGDGSGEDVVQDVFVRLWLRRRELRLAGSLRALLYTLTKHAAIDERRRHARRARQVQALDEPSVSPSPLESAAAAELAAAAAAAVARLPTRRREVFMRVRVQGLTYQEVAESMGLAPQTVANQMSAAMATLRKDLARFAVTAPRTRHDRCTGGILPFRSRKTATPHVRQRATA